MNTLIHPDNTLALIAITCSWVAFSIYAEQTWSWASKLSGAIIALIGAVTLTNLNIIPSSCVWFDDVIWGYVVPLSIPLLLLNCDIKKIWKESGRLLLIFFIGSLGTVTAAFIGYYLLHPYIENLDCVAAMMTGSYIGGGVNFAALSLTYNVPGTTISAATVSDNLMTALYFLMLVAIPSIPFFRKFYKHPHMDQVEKQGMDTTKTQAAAYWKPKAISLKDIAICFAISSVIVWASSVVSGFLGNVIPVSNPVLKMLNGFLGNMYLIMTTISMVIATLFSKKIDTLSGTQEIGTFLIYLFFFVIGVPASIMEILKNAPLLFVFCAILVVINMAFCFIFGKILHYSLEEIILASNANVGGPTTAVAMAVSKGWTELVGPILLVGTLGYVIGTYFGTFVGQILIH